MILNYVINMHSFCYCGPRSGTQVRDTVSMRSRSHRSAGLPSRAERFRCALPLRTGGFVSRRPVAVFVSRIPWLLWCLISPARRY